MVANDPFNFTKLVSAESEIASQTDRLQPKLRGIIVSIHVYMRRLIRFVAVEVEPVGSTSQNRRHVFISIVPRIAQRLVWRSPPTPSEKTQYNQIIL